MVPVANPNTENNLLNLAIILTKSAGGTLLPLHVLSDRRGAISPDAKLQQKHLLSAAVESANAAVINVEPVGRVDDSIDLGIIRSSQEHNASLVICGWKGYSTYRENFLGSVLDNVVRLCPVPILITRFPNPIKNTQRVVLAAADWETSAEAFQQALALVQTLVAELKANLMVLLVWSRGRQPIDPETLNISVDVRVIQERGSLVDKVLENLREDDLLVLIAGSYRFGESVVGRAPETIARLHPETSMIIVNLPKKLEA
jgi:nucleotide-binding universal stress UspA family protein